MSVDRTPRFRCAVAADGAALWDLVKRAGSLDLNSPYAYLMACQNWPNSCVVAEIDGALAGMVIAYGLTTRSDTLFVWQIGVAPEYRGQGLGVGLLTWLCQRTRPAWLETTITPSNGASRALFQGFARSQGVGAIARPWLAASDFPDQHEGEDLFRIGPFSTV